MENNTMINKLSQDSETFDTNKLIRLMQQKDSEDKRKAQSFADEMISERKKLECVKLELSKTESKLNESEIRVKQLHQMKSSVLAMIQQAKEILESNSN